MTPGPTTGLQTVTAPDTTEPDMPTAPGPSPGGDPAPAPETGAGSPPLLADVSAPGVKILARRTQHARRAIAVIVHATSEDLWSTASGRVRISGSGRAYRLESTAARFIPRGGARTFKLGITNNAHWAIRRALRRHRRVSVGLAIEASDVAGNVTLKTRSVLIR